MYLPEKIAYELNDTMNVSDRAKSYLTKSLSYLPEKVVDFVIENCTFVLLEEEDRATYITNDDFRLKGKKRIIIISDKVWSKKIKEGAFVIAHEVAHAYKNHEFRRFEDTDITLNSKRERAADGQAIKWLAPHFKGSFRKYLYKDWQLTPPRTRG